MVPRDESIGKVSRYWGADLSLLAPFKSHCLKRDFAVIGRRLRVGDNGDVCWKFYMCS